MPGPAEPITYFNRHTGTLETEAIYGEGFLRWAYGRPLGRLALHALVKRAAFSRWYGWRMNQPASAARIAPFIAAYGLDEASFASPAASFRSFNEFFSRRLKPSARPVDAREDALVFPADGRHLLIEEISACQDFFVKGVRFDLPALLGDTALAAKFARGSLLISRLCPVDYHRFHFPCDGVADAPRLLNGPLFSVNPIALRRRPSILWENKRYLTRLRSPRAGEVLFLEVGATCVGSVVHASVPGQAVRKGEEKGHFLFGGSTVITVFEPGRVAWDGDLREQSRAGRELYAWMGEPCGRLQGGAA